MWEVYIVLFTINTNTALLVQLFWSLFVVCLTFQQHAVVSQGLICCHTEMEVAD